MLFSNFVFAQRNELDTSLRATNIHSPKKATIRSLILPGWGQAYNRQYWKIPIVATGIVIPTANYFRNNSRHKQADAAYSLVFGSLTSQGGIAENVLSRLPKRYQDAYIRDAKNPIQARENLLYNLQQERILFRKNREYSLLWLVILWGANVADATVSGHLKDFDVSNDLSVKLKSETMMYGQPNVAISICKSLR